MQKTLAIVIPAYKATFLPTALDSIAAQTCQDFTLYIGDDCSPYQLEEIVNRYGDRINLLYRRFDTNLGDRDLVAQWERCIAMTQGEPYIWLFSDDDVMEPRCVETFLNLHQSVRDEYLVHFNVNVLNSADNSLKPAGHPWPKTMTAKEYLDGKLRGDSLGDHYNSYVVEFVFSRQLYERVGGFQNFDLAWGCDFLTWVKMAGECQGIYTVEGTACRINWRKSGENVSGQVDRGMLCRKIHAQIENAVFIKQWLSEHGYRQSFAYGRFVWGVVRRQKRSLTATDIYSIYKSYLQKVGYPVQSTLSFLWCLLPL